jgi:glycosyltransferase involved in cell wall biosynthesis
MSCRLKDDIASLVSVIIPTYNRASMLREAVESVLAQSYRNFELIIVDDGSTDATARELGRYRDRLRVLTQARRGVAAARNAGVRIARGRYLAFLDSDDLWRPEKLEVQTAFITRNPQFQICQTEEIWIRRGVRVNPKARHRKPSGDIFRPSLELCLVSPSAVMMTRDLFETVGGFDERLAVCEDYDLWLRIAVTCPVPLLPTPLVVKRGGHADQLSRSVWGMDRFRILALNKLLRTGLHGEKRRWAEAELRRKIAVFSRGARKRGRVEEALFYEKLLTQSFEETIDVGRTNAPLCAGERVPSFYAGALVGMESTR